MEYSSFFQQHPIVGFVCTICGLVVGYIAPMIDLQIQIPFIVMQVFQLTAWSSAILVGAVTIHGWYKKNFTPKTKKR
jgi:hypothetical protein